MSARPFVFISYARHDLEPVRQVVVALKHLGIETWVYADQLVAGDSWERSIRDALMRAQAILVFITPESMATRYLVQEISLALEHGARIIPVLLRPTPLDKLPMNLKCIHWLDATRFPAQTAAVDTARAIASILQRWSAEPSDTLREPVREDLARAFSAQASGAVQEKAPGEASPPDSVFVVHGHDEGLLSEVVEFVTALNIRPIVMKEVGGATVSLIQTFFEIGGAAKFAIVLLSPDDLGASRLQYDHPRGGTHALKYRSRQNVVLELGYFYGLLGWGKVFVLEKAPRDPVPDFERPSDLNGVLFDRFDAQGRWKDIIRRKLANSGFKIQNTVAS
jgi:predicted nucleotide-binding protein